MVLRCFSSSSSPSGGFAPWRPAEGHRQTFGARAPSATKNQLARDRPVEVEVLHSGPQKYWRHRIIAADCHRAEAGRWGVQPRRFAAVDAAHDRRRGVGGAVACASARSRKPRRNRCRLCLPSRNAAGALQSWSNGACLPWSAHAAAAPAAGEDTGPGQDRAGLEPHLPCACQCGRRHLGPRRQLAARSQCGLG